jgi:hypothetical protein
MAPPANAFSRRLTVLFASRALSTLPTSNAVHGSKQSVDAANGTGDGSGDVEILQAGWYLREGDDDAGDEEGALAAAGKGGPSGTRLIPNTWSTDELERLMQVEKPRTMRQRQNLSRSVRSEMERHILEKGTREEFVARPSLSERRSDAAAWRRYKEWVWDRNIEAVKQRIATKAAAGNERPPAADPGVCPVKDLDDDKHKDTNRGADRNI